MKTETRVGIFIVIAIGIFLYLSVNIGALRLDRAQYNPYRTYFDDTGGLDVKASIKIAGVDVGWVDSVLLMDDGKAEINMMVNKDIKLAKNAYALISQEGLIGNKTLIIEPGDPSTGTLLPGSTLSVPGKSPATVGDLLDQFKDIASSIQDIAFSFKSVFASKTGEENLKNALSGVAKAADRMSDFSEVLERTMKKNEDNINETLVDLRKVAHHLDVGVPSITKNFDDTFPSIKNDANRLTLAFADDTLPKFAKASEKAGNAFESLDSTSIQAREAFKEAEQVAEKLNTGKGVLGKLINEDETYDDLRKTIRGLKDYISKAQTMVVDVDMHSETLLARDWNSKGYLDVRFRPQEDFFYQIQLVADERGTILREEEHKEWLKDGESLDIDKLPYWKEPEVPETYGLSQKSHDTLEFAETVEKVTKIKDQILFGLQFGKRFNRLAFRVGLFENTFGFACDYYVPLRTDKLHWITTLEAFDFKGIKRLDDKRPYVKWYNKLFFMKNIYTTFGFDDVIGRKTSGPFIGGGFRFGDDDLKYLFSMLPVSSVTSGRK